MCCANSWKYTGDSLLVGNDLLRTYVVHSPGGRIARNRGWDRTHNEWKTWSWWANFLKGQNNSLWYSLVEQLEGNLTLFSSTLSHWKRVTLVEKMLAFLGIGINGCLWLRNSEESYISLKRKGGIRNSCFRESFRERERETPRPITEEEHFYQEKVEMSAFIYSGCCIM